MNLILYIGMSVTGFLSCLHELWLGRANRGLLTLTIMLFVLVACSRIGYSPVDDDLTIYIGYFQGNDESYFEPGYMFITQFVRFFFGDAAQVLVTTVSLWIVFFVMLAAGLSEYSLDTRRDAILDICYPGTMLFLVIMYWGCFFAAETLRVGMAIALLYCSCVLAINDKKSLAFIPALIAPFFHLSSLLFLVGIAVVYIFRKLTLLQFVIWFIIMILIDVIMELFKGLSLFDTNEFFQMIAQVDTLAHYSDYGTNEEPESYFSSQYVTYHLMGIIMLLGDLEDQRYNRSVLFYYMGLLIGTLFQSLMVVIRMQWVFLAMVVFPLYYFLKNDSYSLKLRSSVASLYGCIQGVMLLRVLGWHV